ncbi:MAG: folate family ECF transporter S component [Eubacteriales bacterium]|nr:folate family ECF transporter S component [Eubacteriales bacterium]
MLKNTDKNTRALKMHRWDHAKTVGLVTCAMLTALGVVLGGLLSIPAMPLGSYSLKIGFGALPVIVAGVLYGPYYGAIVGALTDFIQAMIFPKGAYMPWFTIVGMLFGLIPGLFFMKKQEPKFIRILLAVAVGQIVSSVICNTILIAWLYGLPLWQTMLARAINQAVMIPLYSIITYGCIRLMKKAGITRV